MNGIVVARVAAGALVGALLGLAFFLLLRLNVRLYASRKWPLAIVAHLARWSFSWRPPSSLSRGRARRPCSPLRWDC